MEQFPWTESGLELLLKINMLIGENGGRERYADKIESEMVKMKLNKLTGGGFVNKVRPKWSYEHETILRKNIGKLSFKSIGELVGRSENNVYNKAYRLGIAIRKY